MSVQTPTSCWRRGARALARPVDAASLAVFRLVFGGVMAWELTHAFTLGRIERQFVQPALLFPYLGFGWLPRLAPQPMFALHVALIGAALCVALGLAYRLAAVVLFVGYSYTFLIDQAQYQNHLYLFCLMALIAACIDAHRTWSFDARSARGPAWVPAWQPALSAFQVGVVYVFGGINKLSASWLSGVPIALELDHTFAALGVQSWAFEPAVAQSFAVAGALIDLGAVPGLLWRRTRAATFVVLCIFHLSNAKLFSIGVFPWFMIGASTLFFPPDWPRRLVRSQGRAPSDAERDAVRGGLLLALGAYCLLQLLVPLRYHLYGTGADWTSDAAYFRWSMKLHARAGEARCFVRFPDRREREVDLSRLLSPRQRQHLAYTPDMIHRFTLFMEGRYPRRLGHDLRWESGLSLDGRAPQPYVVASAQEILRLPVSLAPSHFVRPMQDPELPSLAELQRRAAGRSDGASFPGEHAAR